MSNHSWEAPRRIDANNTIRTCQHCGTVRRTRHEPDNEPPHWTEYETAAGKRIGEIGKTPACTKGSR